MENFKIIGIVGSRKRDTKQDYNKVEKVFLEIYKPGDRLCSGGCPTGGDKFAEQIAKRNGIPIIIFFPAWNSYGKAAGFYRNTLIVKESDVLIACVSNDRTGGTEDTIRKFRVDKPHGAIYEV